MLNRNIRSRRLVMGFLAMLLAMAGCGGGNGGSPTASPTPTLVPDTATPVPTETAGQSTPTVTPTATAAATVTPSGTPQPNIVFIIMDDVGIDQLKSFGLGQGILASTPNLDALANAGVRFSNAWSMPECSPSRATIFTGRYPLRTGVTSALLPNMLPQAQVSPYETTLPRLLAQAGYTSAMVGKYHLGNRNPAGNCSPRTLGFDYFDGNMEAGPPAIDPQAGIASGESTDLSCGFEQDISKGNCYFQDGSCRADFVPVPAPGGGTQPAPVDGSNCLQAGGVFVMGSGGCQATSFVSCPDGSGRSNCVQVGSGEAVLDFERPNGYYAWPQTITSGVLSPDTTTFTDPACGEPPLGRVYMTIAQTSDSIAWYHQQTGPRMLTVSYNSIHTPYQQSPTSLASLPALDQVRCSTIPDDRVLGDNMLESMDREIGRLLAQLNLATLDENGTVQTVVDGNGYTQIPELQASNTMVVVVGDNGSFFEVAKLPFDPLRSKGTVFQTGVSVPLIVAGPLVKGPTGREVTALVNVADLYDLFAEIAGVDPNDVVPPAHTLDAQPMLAYLTNPDRAPIRQFNFTQLGPGVFDSQVNNPDVPLNPAARSWPCVFALGGLGSQCDDVIADTQSFCHTNGGTWWGPTDTPDCAVVSVLGEDGAKQGEPSCCAVIAALEAASMSAPTLAPIDQYAVRNQTYKLVRRDLPDCTADDGHYPPDNLTPSFELYDLTPTGSLANPLGLDTRQANLLCAVRESAVMPSSPPTPAATMCPDGSHASAVVGAPSPTPSTGTCSDGSACDLNTPTSCLTPNQMANYNGLQEQLDVILGSQAACTGDGNLDQRVDQRDADGVTSFATAVSPLTLAVGGQSFFDFNTDAETNDRDAQIVAANSGTDCIGACRRADLNHDGYVNDADASLLEQATGPCELCSADLNDDGQVNEADRAILEGQLGCSTPSPTPTRLPTQPTPTPRATPTPFLCNDQCIPDATGRQCGCELYVPGETTLPPDSGVSCAAVCQEYASCVRDLGPFEIGYTCDATLCTSRNVGIVTEGCYGIQACDFSETLKAERAAGCSCCASQLCGCTATAQTDQQVRVLDAQQRRHGGTPQCDINGTLCGG